MSVTHTDKILRFCRGPGGQEGSRRYPTER